jgi:demethylspheroidene O-methyltransferase
MTVRGEPAVLRRKSGPPECQASSHDRWLAWRNRLLGDRRFQRWAAGFPLLRKIADKRAQALFDLCAGFVYSQILLACVRLRLFDILAERQYTITELSGRLSLAPQATTRLLNAAVALRLAERRSGGRFGLGVLGAAFQGNPEIAAMVEHHALLYADLRDPVSLLRRRDQATRLANYWSYANADRPDALLPSAVTEYSALMSASQALIADDVLDAWSFHAHRCLLDVGGGEGTFLIAAAKRAPNLALMLYELPAVADRARSSMAAAGLAHRATVVSGDFFRQPLPQGADIVTLVRVLHDHDDARAVALLHAVRRALPKDGMLLIAEPMSGVSANDTIGDAYFGFYLLAMGSGRVRRPQEFARLLCEAGFNDSRALPTRRPMLTSAIVARPAG